MGDIEERQKIVLGGLLCLQSKDSFVSRITMAMKLLDDKFFIGKMKTTFSVVCRYFILTGARISKEELILMLKDAQKVSADVVYGYDTLYQELEESLVIEESRFSFAISALAEGMKTELLGTSLADTVQVLVSGKENGKKHLYGYKDARHYLSESLGQIDKMDLVFVPEGDINREKEDMLLEYGKAKESDPDRIYTGFMEVDALTNGLQRGELVWIAGFTGDGKTTLSVNIAHNVVYGQHKNVVYATGETLRTQVRRRLVSIRSMDAAFGVPEGLDYKAIKEGSLSMEQEDTYRAVLEDMHSGEYGKLMIFQFPNKASVSYLENQLARYQSQFNVDLFIVDEARLLSPDARSHEKENPMDCVIKALKQLSITHNKGKGVPIISPYQVARRKWEEAVEGKRPYDKTCFGNTAEAERSCDLGWTVLRLPDSPTEIRSSVCKYRDGMELPEFYLNFNPATCFMSSRSHSSVLEDI